MAVDITINETIDSVDITVNPNIIEVNVTRTSGGGGSQTLAQTLALGNQTGGENIVINDADAIELENNSSLKKGSYDFGGDGGISRICSVDYEDMWQAGIRHVFDNNGLIRHSTNCFDVIPDSSFDNTLRFKVGSFWTLDNGTTYICTDATEGAAVWELYSVGATPTLQQVTDEGNTTTNDIIVSRETGTSYIQVANNDNTLTIQVDSVDGSLIELNDTNNNNYGSLTCGELLMTSGNSSENVQINSNNISLQSASAKPLIALGGSDGTLTGSVEIKTDLVDGNYTQQLPDKSGTFAMLDDVSGVPYTGATQDVNLGEFGLLTGNIEFDTTPTNIPTTAGSMVWNDTDGTVDLKLKGGNVTLQIGQENVIRVVNKTATNINLLESNYQAVRVTGAQGQRLKVDLAQATTDALSAETIGLVTETINNNQEGFITTGGLIRNVNTTGSLQSETWADGDILYLSPTTAGQLTKVKPTAPNHLVIIGYVVHAHATQGSIFVKVDNGYELNELHNVKITSETNGQALTYTSATDIWENKTIIQDSLIDGVTTIAPSQNAVFDAFQFTRRLITNGTGSVTGTTAETIITSLTIPANTLDSKCFIWSTMDYFKTSSGSCTLRLYVNTANSLSGATFIGFVTLSSNRNVSFNRKLYLNGTTLDFLNSNTAASQVNGEFIEGLFAASSTLTVNPANDIFFIYTTQNDATSTTATAKQGTIQKMKLN